jgi:hypothetical protein
MSNKIASVKVGGFQYKIVYIQNLRDDDGKLDGRIHHGKTIIQVEDDLSPQAMPQTILHEVVHAIHVQIGRTEQNKDESYVDALAHSIYQVMRDNPELVRMIVKK